MLTNNFFVHNKSFVHNDNEDDCVCCEKDANKYKKLVYKKLLQKYTEESINKRFKSNISK